VQALGALSMTLLAVARLPPGAVTPMSSSSSALFVDAYFSAWSPWKRHLTAVCRPRDASSELSGALVLPSARCPGPQSCPGLDGVDPQGRAVAPDGQDCQLRAVRGYRETEQVADRQIWDGQLPDRGDLLRSRSNVHLEERDATIRVPAADDEGLIVGATGKRNPRNRRSPGAGGSPRRGDDPPCPETGEYGDLLCPRPDTHFTYMINITLTTEFVLPPRGAW
jgi:hypothetical protein